MFRNASDSSFRGRMRLTTSKLLRHDIDLVLSRLSKDVVAIDREDLKCL